MNNDGRPDLIYADNAGTNCLMISYNQGGQIYLPGTPVFGRITSAQLVNPSVADIDNDNDLDLIFADAQGYLRILENTATPNTPPLPPAMLRAKFLADTVHFKWHPGTDGQQSPLSLRSNLRVGTSRFGSQVYSPNSDSITGARFIYNFANAYQDTSWQLRKIQPGKYFYSVQSIDNSRAASAFSNIDSVFVCSPVTALLPKDKNGASDTTLLFKWTSAVYADGYQLQIGYDKSLNQTLYDSLIADTSLLLKNLPPDTLLYWRVRSYNADGQSAWTTTTSFDTKKLSIQLNWDYTAQLCNSSRGMGVNVFYKGFWNTGNQFILEISDYLGNFNNGRVLNTITDSIPPNVININLRGIPLTNGSNYKLRLRSTQAPYLSYESPAFRIQNSDYTAFFSPLPSSQCLGTNVSLSYYELSNTADSSHWFRNNQQINTLRYPSHAITISQPGYYRVDAYSSYCMAIDSFTYFGTDCYKVWPGDANSDTKVDEVDLFTVGRNMGKTGAARTDQGNDWRSHDATNWPYIQQNYYNLKHSDCNGDGAIDAADTVAISLNYGLTHPLERRMQLLDSLPQTSDLISVNFDKSDYNSNETVTGSIIVGSASKQVMLSGLSFDITMPDSLISPGTFKIYVDSSGIFYKLGPSLNLSRNRQWIIHSANNKQIRGYGSVAKFSFVLNPVAPGSLIKATAENVIMTNLHGFLWTTVRSVAAIAHSSNIITGINSPGAFQNSLKIWPNPVTNKIFYLKATLMEPLTLYLRLYNSQGQQIEITRENWNAGDNRMLYTLPTGIAPGIYLLRIDTKKETLAYKLVVL